MVKQAVVGNDGTGEFGCGLCELEGENKMSAIVERMTKTGKKMFITEAGGKTYAAFDIRALDALLADKPVSLRQGTGNWVWVDFSTNPPEDVQPSPQPTVAPAPTTSLVLNGKENVIKEKLRKITVELNEIINSLSS